jgi:hypothetical protein
MDTEVQSRKNIGEFDLPNGHRFRAYVDPWWMRSGDAVTVSRVWPDPNPRVVMTATGLDSARPRFTLPKLLNPEDRAAAQAAIVGVWRNPWRSAYSDWNLESDVLQIYIGDRRLRVLRRYWANSITAELLQPDSDNRAPVWAATAFRLDLAGPVHPSPDHPGPHPGETRPFLRMNFRFADWLGRDDRDAVGKAARSTLRAAIRRLWTTTAHQEPPATGQAR